MTREERCEGESVDVQRGVREGMDGRVSMARLGGSTLHAADQGRQMHKDQRCALPEPAPCKARKRDARKK